MAETIKCNCSHCGAKYRLPIEAQGRTARCKRCGEKFHVPRSESLEDSILTWLTAPDEEEVEEAAPAQPRVISMQAGEQEDAAATARRPRSTIRMKSNPAEPPKQESA
ncbi:MAG: hypothetical protein AB1716_14155 [Planctomycetota bacterium]